MMVQSRDPRGRVRDDERPAARGARTARSATTLLILGCLWNAVAGAPAAADLAGVWRVEVDARTTGGPFFCQLIPELHEASLDTVDAAAELAALLRAVVPDSLGYAFDSWCELSPPSPAGADQAEISCELPLTLVAPCSLSVRFELIARRTGADSVRARGTGSGVLHGTTPCPRTTCPGTVEVRLTRQRAGGNQ